MQNCTWNFDPEHGMLLQWNKFSSASHSTVTILLPDYSLISRLFCVKNTSGTPCYCKSIGITVLYSWQVYKKKRLLAFCWYSQNQEQHRFRYVKYIDHYKGIICHGHSLLIVVGLKMLFKVRPLKTLSEVIYHDLSIFL